MNGHGQWLVGEDGCHWWVRREGHSPAHLLNWKSSFLRSRTFSKLQNPDGNHSGAGGHEEAGRTSVAQVGRFLQGLRNLGCPVSSKNTTLNHENTSLTAYITVTGACTQSPVNSAQARGRTGVLTALAGKGTPESPQTGALGDAADCRLTANKPCQIILEPALQSQQGPLYRGGHDNTFFWTPESSRLPWAAGG